METDKKEEIEMWNDLDTTPIGFQEFNKRVDETMESHKEGDIV